MAVRPAIRLTAPAFRLVRSFSVDAAAPLIISRNVPAPNSGHIRILELNRQKARNAISKDLLALLRQEIKSIHMQYTLEGDEIENVTQGSPTRTLIIASAIDETFCAGADLRERRTFTQEETAKFLADLRSTFSSIAALPIPTISAISSYALGGGLEMSLCTHFRVMASTASVGLPETRLGIIPGAGGTFRLPVVIGLARARDLILTGRLVSAREAFALGLADRLVEVVPDETPSAGGQDAPQKVPFTTKARLAALDEAIELANQICQGGPIAVRAGLKAVTAAREEVENESYLRVVNTEDRNEALAAFQQKRKPVFKGR